MADKQILSPNCGNCVIGKKATNVGTLSQLSGGFVNIGLSIYFGTLAFSLTSFFHVQEWVHDPFISFANLTIWGYC